MTNEIKRHWYLFSYKFQTINNKEGFGSKTVSKIKLNITESTFNFVLNVVEKNNSTFRNIIITNISYLGHMSEREFYGEQSTKVSGQFIQDTIPESIDNQCSHCQLLETEIKRLKNLIKNFDSNEIKKEAIEDFAKEVIINQFYNKTAFNVFYQNYIRELEHDK